MALKPCQILMGMKKSASAIAAAAKAAGKAAGGGYLKKPVPSKHISTFDLNPAKIENVEFSKRLRRVSPVSPEVRVLFLSFAK
jgi:hypothetical protein